MYKTLNSILMGQIFFPFRGLILSTKIVNFMTPRVRDLTAGVAKIVIYMYVYLDLLFFVGFLFFGGCFFFSNLSILYSKLC